MGVGVADETPKLIIKDISSGGPSAHGHEIQFTLGLESGSITLTCREDLLPKLLETLRQFGEMAARIRSTEPGGLVALATPITVVKG